MVTRCGWVSDDPLYIAYHDEEWGVPLHDDRALYELLMLEGFQAGLSWITVLRKRAAFRAAFDSFRPEVVARYDEAKQAALMADAGIVRNRAKIAATIAGARAWLEIMEREPGGFDAFVWEAVDGRPLVNAPASLAEVPAETDRSRALSRKLKARGFNFVGPTICYAFMQAAGLVCDHTTDCFRHRPAS